MTQGHGYLYSIETCLFFTLAFYLVKLVEQLACADLSHNEKDMCLRLEDKVYTNQEWMLCLEWYVPLESFLLNLVKTSDVVFAQHFHHTLFLRIPLLHKEYFSISTLTYDRLYFEVRQC